MENYLRCFKLQPYKQKSLARRLCEKLAARFYGPFPILERIGQVAYRLDLPPSCKLHTVFHVSQLKKAIGQQPHSPTIPPQLTTDLLLEVEPAALLDTRIASDQSGRTEILIQWEGMAEWEATWEDYKQM
ncbi:uncharacterized protein LOC141720186 [Apium graveolens]|uniref:uncharacterized protein LOC141720186 n=1 Tax=Apium graveolens TaxID=4045 RepID=UPI003D7AA396